METQARRITYSNNYLLGQGTVRRWKTLIEAIDHHLVYKYRAHSLLEGIAGTQTELAISESSYLSYLCSQLIAYIAINQSINQKL